MNLHANPAKSEAARAKISAARQGKPTTSGPLPSEQRKKISAALRGRSHTPEHRAAISAGVIAAGCKPPANEHLIGEAHWNWRGGHSAARQADYRSDAYRAFRQAALERDDWTCQDCGKRGGRLHVHHLKPWGANIELRHDPDNGVTLCRPCHHARHRGQPKPPPVASPRTIAELRSGQT